MRATSWLGSWGGFVQEWSDEFVTQAQHELTSMVTDWKYDYGVSDRDCSAMLLWMLIKLNPDCQLDASVLDP